MTEIRPIHNEDDYQAALDEVRGLWDAEPGTAEHDRLEVLGILIDDYEDRRWRIEALDPVEAIKLCMAEAGYEQADLSRLLGSASRASEILNRKRALTMDMAYKLHREWKIPAEALLKPTHID